MDRSITKYNDELLATKDFKCSRCREILHPPTTFIPEIGNICWLCTSQTTTGSSQNAKSSPSIAFDALLETMLFPCPFLEGGCSKRFRYNEIISHKNSCKYRQERCFFSPLCKWEGNIEELPRHLSVHKEAILEGQGGNFVIKNEKSVDKKTVAILLIDNVTFVLRLLVDHVRNKIWYKLYDPEEKGSKYKISVQHIGHSVNSLQTSCAIVQKVEASDFDISEATEVDIATLEHVIKPKDTYETVIKIVALEQVCTHKPFICFFQECVFRGNYDAFTNHLQSMHEERVFSGKTHNFIMAFYMEKHVSLKRYAMLFDNKIFLVSYKQDLDYTYWSVNCDFSENPEEEYSYFYEVCLINTKKPDQNMIFTYPCLTSVSDENIFSKGWSLPNDFVMSCSNNNLIKFRIKIEKQDCHFPRL